MIRVSPLGHSATPGEVIRSGWPIPITTIPSRARSAAVLRQYAAAAQPSVAGRMLPPRPPTSRAADRRAVRADALRRGKKPGFWGRVFRGADSCKCPDDDLGSIPQDVGARQLALRTPGRQLVEVWGPGSPSVAGQSLARFPWEG